MKFEPKFSLFRSAAGVNLTRKAAKFDGEAYAKARQNDVK